MIKISDWCRTGKTSCSCCPVHVQTGKIKNWLPAQTKLLIPPLLHFRRSPPFPQPRSNTDICRDPASRTCSRISPVNQITNNQFPVRTREIFFLKETIISGSAKQWHLYCLQILIIARLPIRMLFSQLLKFLIKKILLLLRAARPTSCRRL